MQSQKDLKKRIRSVASIEQITKAMEVVSMTKMRKSQAFALKARPYAVASLELLHNLLHMNPHPQPLFEVRPVRTRLLVVVTADKGLAGAFNENVLRRAMQWIAERDEKGESYEILAIGKKAKDHFDRRKIPIDLSLFGFGDYVFLHETMPVANHCIEGFLAKRWDRVEAVYTHFRTTLRQETVLKRILPVREEGLADVIEGIVPEYGKFHELSGEPRQEKLRYNYEYKFEPDPDEVLAVLISSLIRVHIHHVILESNASEHSARMVAMKSASENASELGSNLTLSFNKARQAGITQELSEIIAGQSVGTS